MQVRALGCALLVLVACGEKPKDDKPPQEQAPAEVPVDPGEASLQVAAGDPPVDGPVPPEVSAVFFTVEGALYPLGCYDHEKRTLSDAGCLALVATGADVRLSSIDAEYNKKAGAPTEPQCLTGSGKQIAIAVEGITEGAEFVFGTWPPAAMKLVYTVPEDTLEPGNLRLSDDETQKLTAAVKQQGTNSDTLVVHQIATIDLDGVAPEEKVYSVHVPHPSIAEQYAWSGLFLAPGGDLGALVVVETSKTKRDVFEVRGTLDLDGDGKRELWTRLLFAEGSGDHLVKIEGSKAVPLGKFSCGV